MKKALLVLGCTLLLAACGAQTETSSTLARSSHAQTLAAKLAHVACVKSASPEMTVGIPEDPTFHSQETGNVIVIVKDSYTVSRCAKQIKQKVPHTQILDTLDSIKLILVKGA